MNVRFFSNYATSEELLKRFLANYSVWDDELSFKLNEDYEYAVVFNRTDEIIRPSARIITIIQEPSWSKANENNRFLRDSDYLIVHDAELFERSYGIKLGGQVIESPSYMFFHDRVDKTFFHYAASTKKVKKLSMVVSYLNKPLGIYQKRTNLLHRILDSDLDIDIYGWRLNIKDPRYKGFIDYKFTGLLPYEYSIAIENSEEKNYVTEKFIDCVLCNTIPIYHGAPNVDQIYDNRFFSRIDPQSTTIIEDIKAIITKPAPYSMVNKRIYMENYNLYKQLKDLILC
ncbi:Glycosyltransferase family 10 (fucosyltransferase) C-term [Pedobacter westerhofensis]|uniref:Glycosyltransferase family 10 (Fucosyltransferase) C-term n=1 Tax=Pedobacter westerhofensis TaxID=425512 RepID=A0A521FT37_9SPHI|nr:glycosyltransferase family 10 [Pedobacter westerhofensis]SMO98700.1 Glycosyltransferase family 10 (fucosyltransferase) C-term [Pedobacter westerhofensis]